MFADKKHPKLNIWTSIPKDLEQGGFYLGIGRVQRGADESSQIFKKYILILLKNSKKQVEKDKKASFLWRATQNFWGKYKINPHLLLDTISTTIPRETREIEPQPSTSSGNAVNVKEAYSTDAADVASVKMQDTPTTFETLLTKPIANIFKKVQKKKL